MTTSVDAIKNTTNHRSSMWIFGTMLVCGALGLLAAFFLSVERIEQLINPNAQLLCNFNAIFNCGTVMQTWQAKVFGFPNSFLGLIGYSVVMTVAVVGLTGARLPRWYWMTAQVFYGLGLIFAYWLFFQSVYVIQVLCPLCLVVTVVTTLLFETLLRYNLRENTFGLKPALHKKILGLLKKDYDKFAVGVWLAAMTIAVLLAFPGIYS